MHMPVPEGPNPQTSVNHGNLCSAQYMSAWGENLKNTKDSSTVLKQTAVELNKPKKVKQLMLNIIPIVGKRAKTEQTTRKTELTWINLGRGYLR